MKNKTGLIFTKFVTNIIIESKEKRNMIGKIKEENGEKKIEWIAGRAEGQGVPIGCIMAIYGNTAPNASWLICDGSTFDAETYPALALYLGGNRLPDLRECVLVGAGQSNNEYDASTNPNGIHAHDVYDVGEFKDDQFQGHEHGVKNIPSNRLFRPYDYSVASAGNNRGSFDSQKAFNDFAIIEDNNNNGTPRIGTTTHGKQVGVNYIIKATSVSAETDHAAILAQAMAYMRDQNELSEWESITLSTDSNNPTVMDYDGFISISGYCIAANGISIYINNTIVGMIGNWNQSAYVRSTVTLPIKNGDRVYYTTSGNTIVDLQTVAYYKLRDYSNR